MQYVKHLFVILILICRSAMAQEAPSSQKVMNYVQEQLPHYGVLKNSDGFVYVDVDDEYIHKLIAYIQEDGFVEPPYFGTSDLVGAHITVIHPAEVKRCGIKKIQECGEVIYFIPKECKVAHPPQWNGIDEVYFIVVDAPELERIRKKYGLPKPAYDFHITIGVKPKVATAA